MPKLEFWYEFASTYTYLSVMRIEEEADRAGVEIVWRPFLLGPIFNAQGWETSPFNLYPEKGAYMWRDMDRLCAERGLPFAPPDPFPQNSLYAARLALLGAEHGWAPRFSRAVFSAQFGEGMQLADKIALGTCLDSIGLDGEALLARIGEDDVKEALKAQTEQARGLGIFGAPSFVTEEGELFWGDDRLEQALKWAVSGS